MSELFLAMVALFVFSLPLVPTHPCTFWESTYSRVRGLLYDRPLPPRSHAETLWTEAIVLY